MSKKSIKSDLARLGRMKDSDIDYSDIPPLQSSDRDSIERGLFPMEKETSVTRTPPLPKVPPRTEQPVRTMSVEKARKLIRKTSAEHAGLFRRLAK